MPFTEFQRYMPFYWPFIMLRHDFKGAKVHSFNDYYSVFFLNGFGEEYKSLFFLALLVILRDIHSFQIKLKKINFFFGRENKNLYLSNKH
jgi:hypothetical protein